MRDKVSAQAADAHVPLRLVPTSRIEIGTKIASRPIQNNGLAAAPFALAALSAAADTTSPPTIDKIDEKVHSHLLSGDAGPIFSLALSEGIMLATLTALSAVGEPRPNPRCRRCGLSAVFRRLRRDAGERMQPECLA